MLFGTQDNASSVHYTAVTAAEFDPSTAAFFERCRREFEFLGFRRLGAYTPAKTTARRGPRYVLHYISASSDTFATAASWTGRRYLAEFPLPFIELTGERQERITLETYWNSGRRIVTTNCRPSEQPEDGWMYLPDTARVNAVVAEHQSRKEALLTLEESSVVTLQTLDDYLLLPLRFPRRAGSDAYADAENLLLL